MSDLFESMQEHHAERLAIMQESGVPNPVESAADDLFAAEDKSCMRHYYPNKGNEAAAYFKEVEKKRGIGPAGNRILVGSTTQLLKRGFALYLQQVEAFGAGLGVIFHEAPGRFDA